jgi:LytS/YehU family sensor histidine kinase
MATPDGESLELSVRNDADGHADRVAPDAESSGVGLANLERRLALAYGTHASFHLERLTHGAIARIHLPLELPVAAPAGRVPA